MILPTFLRIVSVKLAIYLLESYWKCRTNSCTQGAFTITLKSDALLIDLGTAVLFEINWMIVCSITFSKDASCRENFAHKAAAQIRCWSNWLFFQALQKKTTHWWKRHISGRILEPLWESYCQRFSWRTLWHTFRVYLDRKGYVQLDCRVHCSLFEKGNRYSRENVTSLGLRWIYGIHLSLFQLDSNVIVKTINKMSITYH